MPNARPVTVPRAATDPPVIRTRRPADHRSRARRWHDAVGELTTLQTQYAKWLEALAQPARQRASRCVAADLRSRPRRTPGNRPRRVGSAAIDDRSLPRRLDRLKCNDARPVMASSMTKSLLPWGRPHKWLRYKHRISPPRPPTDILNVRQVRDRYGVSLWVVHYWIGRGVITAQQRKPNAPYEISIDEASDRLLREWIANSVHLHPSSQTQAA